MKTNFNVGDYVKPDLRGAFVDKKAFEITAVRTVGNTVFAQGSAEGSYPVWCLIPAERPQIITSVKVDRKRSAK